jgi:hypothetical protein
MYLRSMLSAGDDEINDMAATNGRDCHSRNGRRMALRRNRLKVNCRVLL